ncbi:MAG: TM0106 family RecB-like putative nuclease [Phenylobacterium sp.]|nr:TM0106 family RecB-like putative nuclease [Phenylobacterium sp.]
MRIYGEKRLYSASDLVNFLGCTHATGLDVRQLSDPVEFPPDDAHTVLLQEKGLAHEKAYLERLRAEGRSIVEVSDDGSLETRAARTLDAMREGADVVYQGALLAQPWHGYSDFLLKVERPSIFGGWAYDVADTKLSQTAKPSHVLQLCVYADLLARAQGAAPHMLHVVLGAGGLATLRASSVQHYFAIAKARFERFGADPGVSSGAEPCGHCTYCRWSATCEAEWEAAGHLSLVAGMNRGQIVKLRAAGVGDLRSLTQTPLGFVVPGLNAETFAKLRSQADLQMVRRDTGNGKVEVLPLIDGKGFNRLPRLDPGDLFFDMEGDPLIEDRLEYLFGFVHLEGGEERFTPFWAHDRQQEKVAFERAVDFITARLAAHPEAHVYHYAAYEESALKRLAMYHGTRESEVDDLLRQGRLVDLYRVVREAIRTSEPGYSIKNLEAFYLDGGRGGEVKTAGDSIVVYERWRALQDPVLLQEIADYNELDCRSTRLCRDWLITLRPATATWRTPGEAKPPTTEKLQERKDADERTQALVAALLATAVDADRPWRELLSHLLEFHRREAKPAWWAMFARQEMADHDLLDDAESLAMLSADLTRPPRDEKKSKIYAFTFPAQDFKLRLGDKPLRAGSGEPAGEIVFIDDASRRVELKLGPSRTRMDDGAALIPEGPVGDRQLRDAVYRYAGAVVDDQGGRYSAITDILARRPPRLTDGLPGEPIISAGADTVPGTIAALQRLDGSHLLIQGPPGAGKTYTSSHAIVALLAQGARIGVASNSHKAINNLLGGIQEAADTAGVKFQGVKKSSNEDQHVVGCASIENTTDNKRAIDPGFQLHAGTAWLFARPELDGQLDYLFVDEAGQVSLANLIAMGVAAKNIVLVGDQMQLSQPIQGDHPGGSGISGLDHLMGENSTVPPDRGVFLGVTRRMHPDVCRFISDAVYDGRLESHSEAKQQRLVLPAGGAGVVAATGLRFQFVAHQGCAQKSLEEAEQVVRSYTDLLRCGWVNDKGEEQPLTSADILVVSPYNMQVDLLRSMLPAGARVGTVDKFQGQEGAVVLISMATSSGDDLPRHIEFLYSRNRLNVAISRARCLAVIFASPRLLEIPCSTIFQMQLVNTLCWAKVYADSLAGMDQALGRPSALGPAKVASVEGS